MYTNFTLFMIRFILGVLFFFQAYDVIFRIGIKQTYETVFDATRDKNIPDWFTKLSVIASSYIQLIGGAFLIFGFLIPFTTILLGFNLMMVVLGFSYLKGLWDMRHVFPRLFLLILIMLLPKELDLWNLDYIFQITL